MRAWLREHLDWESVVIGLLIVMAVAALIVGFGVIAVAFVVWYPVGLGVARWSWRWYGIYPTTTKGHLALGATAWVWPLLLAAVGATAAFIWGRHLGDDR